MDSRVGERHTLVFCYLRSVILSSNSGESFTVFVYCLTKLKSNNRTLGFLLKQFQNANVHVNISTWGDIEIGTI